MSQLDDDQVDEDIGDLSQEAVDGSKTATEVIKQKVYLIANCVKCGWSNSGNDSDGLCKLCRKK